MIYSKDGILDDKFKVITGEEAAQIKESIANQGRQAQGDVFTKPEGLYFKIIPYETYIKLRKMNNSNIAIQKWSKQLIRVMAVTAGALFIIGMMFNTLIMLGALIVPGLLYAQKIKGIDTTYLQWTFERRIQFSKFSRLLIPYLRQATQGVSMFGIFGKVAERLDSQHDRDLLNGLRNEIMSRPNDIEPYMNYAEQASGTDKAVLFMSTLYDIRMGAVDMSIVTELGQMATAELMDGINQIIEIKSKRFLMFPSKLTMLLMVIIMGFGIGIGWYTIKETGIMEAMSGF